ncbi:MAG: hypothetical protein QOG50_1430 [Actinomycetota bacterium]|nr:hypothetical protein [Actinomycetota bacterium]
MPSQLLDDYSGPFDPAVGLADFSRKALAPLGREYLLHGQHQDRDCMPLVLARHTRQDMLDVAIEEWMAASPLYSLRTQRALAFGNADVPTIFKNIQLDIGAPHQFMDFQYRVDDERHGEFWLDHCGALMDVEPMGEEFVFGMCHDIEDPTFDATAGATNPYAKVRPIHRPPRAPADRSPHCHWRVVIDPTDGAPVEPHPTMGLVGASEIARIVIDDPGRDAEPGGWFDYSGDFDPGFTLEDLSHRALVVALQEVAVQTHLLAHAYLHCVASRWGVDEAVANAPQVFTGVAGVAAGRLPAVLGIRGDDAEAIAKLLQLHPAFHPRTYVAPSIELVNERTVRFALADAPCFHEHDGLSWLSTFGDEPHPALDAIAHAINPRAFSAPDAPSAGERHAWLITIDPDAQPARPSPSVELARISTGATVKFLPRRDLRN